MTRRDFIRWSVRSLAAAAVIDAFWFEKACIDWTEFSWQKSAGSSTPFKFVQISDLHLNAVDGTLKDAAARINGLKPDLVLFTGDAVDRKENVPVLDEFLGELDAAIPKTAILGNWEYWGDIDLKALEKTYQSHNGRLLVNSSVSYNVRGKTVLITGFDDLIGNRPDPKQAFAEYRPNDYHIVLNHCPQYRDAMVENISQWPLIDLVLSGHTHGGQINMLGFIPVIPPGSGRYVEGWYKDTFPYMYVSRGIGTSGVPVRFGSRAEITTFQVSL
jgi:uncharacterized protein